MGRMARKLIPSRLFYQKVSDYEINVIRILLFAKEPHLIQLGANDFPAFYDWFHISPEKMCYHPLFPEAVNVVVQEVMIL